MRIKSLIVGIVLGGAVVTSALKYHVVRTTDGVVCVPKRQSTLADTYVDVRTWSFAEWSKHPDLAWSLTQNGKANVIGGQSIKTTLKDAIDSVR